MTYNPGQFKIIDQFVTKPPDWLILGGPSDANESYWAKKIYPAIKVVAIEPIQSSIDFQYANGFPSDGVLIKAGLSNVEGTAQIRVPEDKRAASCLEDRPGIQETIRTVTIDSLNKQLGPFRNVALWLDIEGYEYKALEGARDLFSSGGVEIVNIEILERLSDHTLAIETFFAEFGFTLAHVWNDQPGLVQDRIYVKG